MEGKDLTYPCEEDGWWEGCQLASNLGMFWFLWPPYLSPLSAACRSPATEHCAPHSAPRATSALIQEPGSTLYYSSYGFPCHSLVSD